MVKKNKEISFSNPLKFLLFVITILIIIFSIYFVVADHTMTLTVNETNATTWFKGGTNRSFNFTLFFAGENATTNVTQINISNANFTLNLTNATINATEWICNVSGPALSEPNVTKINCSNTSDTDTGQNFAVNITVWALLPTTTTEINHTWKMEIFDSFKFSNLSRWYTPVDYVAPSDIILPVYTNGTAKKNSATLTLNISVTDAGSGGSVCLIDVNGTSNQTVDVSGGWCNSTAINLTGSTDGNKTIRIYVNDSVNNMWGFNDSFAVQVDTTNPVAGASCLPASVTQGATVTCTCGNSDTGGSGVASYTASSTPSTSETGTYYYHCNVTDNAGNIHSSTDSYVIQGLRNTRGSTPSGTTKTTNLWPTIAPGTITVMKDIDGNAGVKQIKLEVKNEAQNVKITVTKYENKPAEVSLEKTGKTYRYLQIETENLENELEKATMTIQIEKTWMSTNGFDKDNIALFRFDESNENWDELTTTYTEEDDTYYYYDIELTSFSYFAISSKAGVEVDSPETGEPGETAGAEGTDLTWLWIVIGVLVLAAIIGGGIAVKKRKKQ